MAVIHHHLGGPTVERAGDRGTDLLGHQPSGALVLGIAGLTLLRGDDAGNTFDVGGDEDFHAVAVLVSVFGAMAFSSAVMCGEATAWLAASMAR